MGVKLTYDHRYSSVSFGMPSFLFVIGATPSSGGADFDTREDDVHPTVVPETTPGLAPDAPSTGIEEVEAEGNDIRGVPNLDVL